MTPTTFVCTNSDVGMADLGPPPVEVEGSELDITFEGVEAEEFPFLSDGMRELMIASYEVPRWMFNAGLKFGQKSGRYGVSAAYAARELGVLVYYAHMRFRSGRRRKVPMDVDKMVTMWHKAIVGLAMAHDKDEADRFEASIDDCLMPLLSAPIKQIREFAPKLTAALKADKKVPFLVWRSYELWIERIVLQAPDTGVKELKTELAKQVADLVEEDLKPQLGEALVRALQWRSPEKLEKVKQVVEEEKAKGNKPRLRGRESCLFLEVGGTEESPEVCVQV